MLVLSRQRDETIVIGDEQTAMVQLTPERVQAMRECTDPALLDLAQDLLKSMGTAEVTLVDIRGDKCRLGFEFPKHIPVHRKEVYDKVARENREAAKKVPVAEAVPA